MSKNNPKRKIFIVSEDPSDLTILNRTIEKYGLHPINNNHNEEDLVGQIRTSHPDLIFWDERSFDQESLNHIQTLQEDVETQAIPVYLFISQNNKYHKLSEDLKSFEQVSILERGLKEEKMYSLLSGILNPGIGVKFWGVRGSTPCANKENVVYGGNTTCVQVELPFTDELLILDSGTGIRNLGNYLTQFRKRNQGHIFITHPHWDHIQGFPFFKPIYNAENRFDIHMPPQVTGGCREILSGHLTKTYFPVTLDMFDAKLQYITQDSDRQQYNGYSVEYMVANHPINTAIYKLRVSGKTIVFCPDNELTPIEQKTNAFFYKKLKDFLKDADLLIHDAQYNKASYKRKKNWGHSAWETAVDFARRSNVKNVFLTHHDPDSEDAYLSELDEQIQQEYGEYFESVQLAKEGVKVEMEVSNSVSG